MLKQMSAVSAAASDASPPAAPKPADLKIILLGDSAVGKSKLMERFLLSSYSQNTSSTYALTLYKYPMTHPTTGAKMTVDFFDTAGQERFFSMHPTYYFGAHACLLCFDVTRKITYKNLEKWHKELVQYRPSIPVLLIANKIDQDPSMVKREFKFAKENNMELFFVSASDGTNVVKAFKQAINRALAFKESGAGGDFMDEVMDLLNDKELFAQSNATQAS
ncbi:hypothetical protein RI367_002033 [Sorochytrium milnesiophthora]